MSYLINIPNPVPVETYDDYYDVQDSNDDRTHDSDRLYLDNRCGRPLPISTENPSSRDLALHARGQHYYKSLQISFFNAALLAKKNKRQAVLAYIKGLHTSSDPVEFYFHFLLECIFKADEMILKAFDVGKLMLNNVTHHGKLVRKMGLQPGELVRFQQIAFGFLYVQTEYDLYLSIPYKYGSGITQILGEYYKELLIPNVKNPPVAKIRCFWLQGLKENCKHCHTDKQKELAYLKVDSRVWRYKSGGSSSSSKSSSSRSSGIGSSASSSSGSCL